jgi:Protein of unknown function (DUF3089)
LNQHKKGFWLFLSVCLILYACKPAYKSFSSSYSQEFSSNKNEAPDYSQLKYWAAHPHKKDPADSIPAPLRNEPLDSSVDVFFLHPTTLTDKSLQGKVWNANINDAELNAKTDYSSILYQASVFNGSCRVFAPRYRQAHLYSFFATKEPEKAKSALRFAYDDVKHAFAYYLEHFNNGRPIIIASHSQGTVHANLLLREFFEGTPLSKKLICAYIVGMALPQNTFQQITVCKDSSSTGCFVGWRTYRKNYTPEFVKKENGNSWVVNPISWQMDSVKITRKQNTGAVLYNFNKIIPYTNGAQIQNGILWVERPRFPGSLFYFSKNYHPGDINLFYLSIRENVKTRIAAYFKNTVKQ